VDVYTGTAGWWMFIGRGCASVEKDKGEAA